MRDCNEREQVGLMIKEHGTKKRIQRDRARSMGGSEKNNATRSENYGRKKVNITGRNTTEGKERANMMAAMDSPSSSRPHAL